MAARASSWSNLLSNETDVEAPSLQIPIEGIANTPSGGKGSTKRSSNYTQQDEIQLCMSLESINTDTIVGNEQPGTAYWKRIAEHFHTNRTFQSDRSANSLEHRWDTIKKECSKFQALYEQVERWHPSGIPYKEHLNHFTLARYKRTRLFSFFTAGSK
ncbi:glutathione S-transferase T3-like [Panicum miliaceum]|uniref:Glutathione S-transferase T3-like n=1 Tax=Panicum miliaceum TaxID=4540 RepID=A0A3L6QXG6_PANMI|nr:glutathione S-transferase T3-like [Panicum miliaceum]